MSEHNYDIIITKSIDKVLQLSNDLVNSAFEVCEVDTKVPLHSDYWTGDHFMLK